MKKTREQPYSVDDTMWNIASCLVRDFRNNLDDHTLYRDLAEGLNQRDLSMVRELCLNKPSEESIGHFKAGYQLNSLFKRHRFLNDTYTDTELTVQAIEQFKTNQCRLRDYPLTVLPSHVGRMLRIARDYISRVLGKYDDEEHRRLCRFGRRASVGVPLRKASEAERWEIPISGSQSQIDWFLQEIEESCQVKTYLTKQQESDPNRSLFQPVEHLKLTLVPKTYKSLRSIMPNTTIGSYMSFGLGEMIRSRLQRKGHDIRFLQKRHRILAQIASRNNTHVTADQSMASDNITVALVHKLLPADWLEVLDQSRIGKVELPDSTVLESLTYCTMGVGYTFPLQTLVFLALLKAIDTMYFMGSSLISVYGDDMIYHRRLHPFVLSLFPRLGLVINVDKTFCDGNFRESCGGDYYRGVDVRPFQPRNGSSHVSRKAYEAILYKYINGLLMRWTEFEITGTLNYLVSELCRVITGIKIVPGDFPDTSGIKCKALGCFDFLKQAPCLKPKHVGHGVYRFVYLGFKPKTHTETRHEPYLWRRLGGHDIADHRTDHWRHDLGRSDSFTARVIKQMTGVDREQLPYFVWKEARPISRVRSCITGRRLRRLESHLTISQTGFYKRQSGFSCFETRS